jgi:hypothetical protein
MALSFFSSRALLKTRGLEGDAKADMIARQEGRESAALALDRAAARA